MAARLVRGGPLLLVLATLALALPLTLGGGALRSARAQTDLQTEPTTKGEPTSKSTDLSTGSTPLTPTPTAPKTGGAGGVAKPPPSASVEPTASVSAEPSTSAPSVEEPPPSPSVVAPRPFARRKVPLGVGDLEVSISMPEAWAEIPDAQLPEVDATEQVKVVARKGFGVHDPKGKPPVVEEIIVACGRASGDYWADAVRDAAFTQMTAAVEKEASRYTLIAPIEPEAIRYENDRLLQSFAAEAEYSIDGKAAPTQLGKGKPKAANTVKLQGLNFIGFARDKGEDESATPHIVACSIACAHLVAPGDTSLCPAAIGSIEISGTFVPAPKRSFLAELVFKLKSDPTTLWLGVIGVAFILLVAILGVVLAVRRKRAQHDHEHHDDDDEHEADIASEIQRTMHASPPPGEGFFDPQTLARRKS